MNSILKLLVVEDHHGLREVTVETLVDQGHQVIGVDCAEAVGELPADFTPDIAIVDLNLPGEDGLQLAARLRQVQPGIGIIMVTARHALHEKLAGYEHGADLYLTKPTAPEELSAAVEALARRIKLTATDRTSGYGLNVHERILHTPCGNVALRSAEANLLHSLALAPDQTLETWQLLERLGKTVDEDGKAQLQVLASRLRSKLAEHGLPDRCLRAERNKGYRLGFPLQIV
ncbi:MAG: response regulator transcription factor [Rhodoferax sp.]|nr:response regulator transcription factor [Rhodoferax sp.]